MATTGHELEAVNVQGLKALMKKGGNKGLFNEATCSTAGGTAAKVTNTVPPSFSLTTGAKIIVKFTYAISAENATLQVGETAAKPIYYHGAALPANLVQAGAVLLLQYDGTAYNIVGDIAPDISGKQNVITDGAAIGGGIGVSNTVAAEGHTIATTAAQTAALTGYVLTKNIPVSILFNNAIQVVNSTLNINGQGAKPIYYLGSKLQPFVVRPKTIITFVYDGTNYNIVGVEGLEDTAAETDKWVDMGLPSGTLWAKANINVNNESGLTEVNNEISPFTYDCSYFSWGNVEGHNLVNGSFDYDFGASNDGVYASTPGASLNGNLSPSFDAARVNLGSPWRMPRKEDYDELFNSNYTMYIDEDGVEITGNNKVITMDGVKGIRLKSRVNSNTIFFPMTGYTQNQSVVSQIALGYYWSETLYNSTFAYSLYFLASVLPNTSATGTRYNGFAIRPVL